MAEQLQAFITRWVKARAKTEKHRDRPAKDLINEAFEAWFARHPEQRLPILTALRDYPLKEARLGNPDPLAGRVSSRQQLTNDEIQFVIEALTARSGKRAADNLRGIEQYLIAAHVEHLMAEGMLQKAAIAEVMARRNRSERHVYKAIVAQKEKKRRGD